LDLAAKGRTAMLEPANFRVEALAHAQRQNRKYPFVGPTSGDLVQVKLSQSPSHVPRIFESSALPAPKTEMPQWSLDVRSRVRSGKHLLAAGISGFDPQRKIGTASNAMVGAAACPIGVSPDQHPRSPPDAS